MEQGKAVMPDSPPPGPPPDIFSGFDRSPATNATEADAEAGEAWCARNPLIGPRPLDGREVAALNAHNYRLIPPQAFRGTLNHIAPGVWEGRTNSRATDSTIFAYPPLYSVLLHSPLSRTTNPARRKTIYYEVQLAQANHNPPPGHICLALGFMAFPYPAHFRMPGWHRGSLAVHGDDGNRYINDRWGGKAFTEPFRPGERLGIGMTFWDAGSGSSSSSKTASGGASDARVEAEVFFTRQGRVVGRWDLHEETDAEQDLPVTGLEGYHDLACAIGTYGETGFRVIFDPAKWLYKPDGY